MGRGEMSEGGSRNRRLFLVAAGRRRRPVDVNLTRILCARRVGITHARSSNVRINSITDPGAGGIVPEVLAALCGIDNEW